MNVIVDENHLNFVEIYEIFKPLFHKIDAVIDNCFTDCHNKYYRTFEYDCEYDIKLTNIRNNEIFILTIVEKSMALFELNKKNNNCSTKWFYI